jgi:hypothetical protein
VRASDADREVAVEALKRHSAAGRIDSEELAERSGRAYAAQTLAELAEVTNDLPTAPAAAPRARRSRRLPGIAPFSLVVDAERPRSVVMGAVLRELVPALQSYGYELTGQTDTRLHFKLEERPIGSVVLGILTFPIGGFLLFLDKRRSQVSMMLEEPAPGNTRVTIYGNASLAVRRGFEGLRL